MVRTKSIENKDFAVKVTQKKPGQKISRDLALYVVPSSQIRNKGFGKLFENPSVGKITIEVKAKRNGKQKDVWKVISQINDWIYKLESKA